MHPQKFGARAEYRLQEGLRVKDSASLAQKFQKLKSLKVQFTYHNTDGAAQSGEVKYDVNIANAKSVFRLNCPNAECVRGDFDLTEELADAVAAKQKKVSGELICKGWRSRTTIDTVRCENVLRYKLMLGY
jgi:hypothetical protein